MADQNYALTSDKTGALIVAHRADCPDVRRMADEGHPVITMFQCQQPLPMDIQRHDCLKEPEC